MLIKLSVVGLALCVFEIEDVKLRINAYEMLMDGFRSFRK